MAVVKEFSSESGNLSAWDTVSGDAGDVTVTRNAGLAGTVYGIQVILDGGTDNMFCELSLTSSPPNFNYRMYIDPNGLTMADADIFRFVQWHVPNEGSGSKTGVHRFSLGWHDATGFYLQAGQRNDGGSWFDTDEYDIDDKQTLIEVSVTRATSQSNKDSTLELRIDGVLVETLGEFVEIDLYNDWSPYNFRIGTMGPDAGTSGTFLMDEIVITNDDNLIGPVTVAGARGRYETADYGAELRSRYGLYGGRYG